MRSSDVYATLASCRGDAAVIAGPSGIGRRPLRERHRPPTLYAMELAYATPTALGVALARSDLTVIAAEGDGSLLAGCPALVTVARLRPPNLIVLADDNGTYQTLGPEGTDTGTRHGASLAVIGRGCGLPAARVVEVDSAPELDAALRMAMTEAGPWLVVARSEPDTFDWTFPSDDDMGVMDYAVEFRQHLISTRPGR